MVGALTTEQADRLADRSDMNDARDQEIARMTIEAVGALPTREEKSAALSYLLMAAYKPLRTIEGDEFVRGWLESALAEVQAMPPDVEMVDMH
jgi:hypothetical protein